MLIVVARLQVLEEYIALEARFGARNYDPLPVVLTRGEGCYVWDTDGRRYLDMMSAYSAVSHGHSHPRLLRVLADQASRLAVVSRAFHTDRLGRFLQRACEITGMDRALPMNTGVEAVETALKAARRWAYRVKGVPPGKAEIIACRGNFHGRTIAAVGMSSEPAYQSDFGPFPAGFRLVDYGSPAALEAAINRNTAAFIVEPIQGEGGIIVPPDGFLRACADICARQRVLMICDEIQTGLGRTGRLLASEFDSVTPDALVLGKALGGGLYPVSLFLARDEVMQQFDPGSHGSTFGGNAIASAVGLEALNVLLDEGLIENSAVMGACFMESLRQIRSAAIVDVRGRGLLIGVELDPQVISAREVCTRLLRLGVITRETHHTVLRLAPPLIIGQEQIDFAAHQLATALDQHRA
jgi:ornithine--oxo-acid transaminase